MIVFEDDVVLCDQFQERLNGLKVPEDWGIFYLGCIFCDAPEPVTDGVVRVTGRTWETHAMAVHSRLFPRLHRLLAPYSRRRGPRTHAIAWEIAIDNLLAEIHREETVYAAYPALAWQTRGLSNIENGIRGLWSEDGKQLPHREVIEDLEGRIGAWRRERDGDESHFEARRVTVRGLCAAASLPAFPGHTAQNGSVRR